jgi:hypothetical protein
MRGSTVLNSNNKLELVYYTEQKNLKIHRDWSRWTERDSYRAVSILQKPSLVTLELGTSDSLNFAVIAVTDAINTQNTNDLVKTFKYRFSSL